MEKESELKIKDIIQRTYNVKSVRLEVKEWKAFKAGQFMRVSLNAAHARERYLSISSSPTEKDYIEFTKKITQSDFSVLLNTLRPGDSLKAQYPLGRFTLEDNIKDMRAKVAFISGGIGITPIRSICKYVVDKKLGTDIILIYANRSIEDIAFKEDFELMRGQYSGLKVSHVLSEAAPDFECRTGRINAQVIKSAVLDYDERKFFLCGPPSMVEAIKRMLSDELALAGENIIAENFTGY